MGVVRNCEMDAGRKWEINNNELNFASIIQKYNQLRPYQRVGVRFLVNNQKVLLGDDMGLGKTIQALFASVILHKMNKANNCLIVVKKTLIQEWIDEIEKWGFEKYGINVLMIDNIPDKMNNAQFFNIITYDTLLSIFNKIKAQKPETVQKYIKAKLNFKKEWDIGIIDEASVIKNNKTKKYVAIKNMNFKYLFLLTGTPIENSFLDYLCLTALLNKEVEAKLIELNSFKKFKLNLSRKHKEDLFKFVISITKHNFLRREKNSKEIMVQLPPKVSKIIRFNMSDIQKQLYLHFIENARKQNIENDTYMAKFKLLVRLQQICVDPSLINSKIIDKNNPKLLWLKDFIEQIPQQDKVVIFTNFIKSTELIANFIEKNCKGIKCIVYNGEKRNRDELKNLFIKDKKYRVFIATIQSASYGLNLQVANYMVRFDDWWNPAVMKQAEDRIYRIGQNKTVFIYRLMINNSIEIAKYDILERKIREANKFFKMYKKVSKELIDKLVKIELQREVV